MKKQIEKMACDMCSVKQNCNEPYKPIPSCVALKHAERAFEKGYRKQEWISVEERLPEESDWYLANIISPFDFEFVSISHYSRGYGWNNPDRITHWMPLPEAPKMKGGAE